MYKQIESYCLRFRVLWSLGSLCLNHPRCAHAAWIRNWARKIWIDISNCKSTTRKLNVLHFRIVNIIWKRLSYICSRLKSQKTLSVDNCLWGQALSSFLISKSLIIACDLHTAYSTVHFRNHHPLWLFHLIIFYSSLSLPLSKLQKGLILQPLENRPSGVFPTSHFRTSYLCFSLVSREVVMTTCRFQRLSCELNLQRSFFRSSSDEPVNR